GPNCDPQTQLWIGICSQAADGCPFRKSYPDVLMMQSAQILMRLNVCESWHVANILAVGECHVRIIRRDEADISNGTGINEIVRRCVLASSWRLQATELRILSASGVWSKRNG